MSGVCTATRVRVCSRRSQHVKDQCRLWHPQHAGLGIAGNGLRFGSGNDSEAKIAKQAVGNIESQVVAFAVQELIKCRLINARILGDPVDAKFAPAGGVSQDGGEGRCTVVLFR